MFIWTLQDKQYATKPRPVVIIQSDDAVFDSIIITLLTSFDSEDIKTRVKILPTKSSGLSKVSFAMTDISTVDKKYLGSKIGKLTKQEMLQISEMLMKVLAL